MKTKVNITNSTSKPILRGKAKTPAFVTNLKLLSHWCGVPVSRLKRDMRSPDGPSRSRNGEYDVAAFKAFYRSADRATAATKASDAEPDYDVLKKREEYERIRDGNMIRRGLYLKKSEVFELIASGFAPLKHYLESGANDLAQKVAARSQARCEKEIRTFFHKIMRQIAHADFPPEIVQALLDDLNRSALTRG